MNMMTAIIPPPDADPARTARRATLFAAFERDDIELAVDLLIDHLDAIDNDPHPGCSEKAK